MSVKNLTTLQSLWDGDEMTEKELRELYPRAFKLMDKKKYFILVACDEPYFMEVYSLIRDNEIKKERWDAEDEKVYQEFCEIGRAHV